MSKVIPAFRRYCALALIAFLAIAVSSAMAQVSTNPPIATVAATPAEASPVVSHPATSGPISHNYTLKNVDGKLNILVDRDGTWNFSGSAKAFPYKDFDVTLALKNTDGAVVLFQYVGDATHGIEFSKQGKNDILKENFASFAKSHKSAWEYRLYENAAGKRRLYEERLKKMEELKKEEEEARKLQNEALAEEKKAALKAEEQAELKQSGGSSASSVLNTIGSVASAVLWFL